MPLVNSEKILDYIKEHITDSKIAQEMTLSRSKAA